MSCEHVCTSDCRKVGCNCDCGGEWHCSDCGGTGIINKTEWTGDDDSYDVEMSCHCTKEDY